MNTDNLGTPENVQLATPARTIFKTTGTDAPVDPIADTTDSHNMLGDLHLDSHSLDTTNGDVYAEAELQTLHDQLVKLRGQIKNFNTDLDSATLLGKFELIEPLGKVIKIKIDLANAVSQEIRTLGLHQQELQRLKQASAVVKERPIFTTPTSQHSSPKPLNPSKLPMFCGDDKKAIHDPRKFINAFTNMMTNCKQPREEWISWVYQCFTLNNHLEWYGSLEVRNWDEFLVKFFDQMEHVMMPLKNWLAYINIRQRPTESVADYTSRFKDVVVRVFKKFDRNCQHLAFIYYNGFLPSFVEKMNASVFINVRNNNDPDMPRQDLVLQSITYDNVYMAAVLASANLDEGKSPGSRQSHPTPADKKPEAAITPKSGSDKPKKWCSVHKSTSHNDDECYNQGKKQLDKKTEPYQSAFKKPADQVTQQYEPKTRSFHPRFEVEHCVDI
jgi:hypothetical protein